jgi:D-3-phosphoglycerate dehydrogenase / 2-oxoglutarate reductase
MKVLVADKYEAVGLEQLRSIGCEVLYEPDAKGEALTAALQKSGAEVLVVRSSRVTRDALEASRLGLVVRAGAGTNTIDVQAAAALGIYVANCPGKNSAAVAELAFGLMLALDRRIPDNVAQLRAGRWNKKELSKARGLKDRTLGLVGLGSIGQEMIPRAQAFGMRVAAWSRSLTPERAQTLGVEYCATLEELAARADIVSVHLALGPGTRGLVGTSVFAAMRPGACFINTSRAEVLDQAALEAAIREKHIRAGLDVYASEPSGGAGDFSDGIVNLEGVYGTHHIGASTDQAQEAIAAETTRIVKTFKETGRVPNVVNLASRSPATHLLVVRHRDRVGVLAHVLDLLKEAHVNVQEMENVIFDGAEAAIARILLDKGLQPATLDAIQQGNQDILQLSLVPL